MTHTPEVHIGGENLHPHSVHARHAVHQVLTEPGLVEKAGWIAVQATDTIGRIGIQTGKVLNAATHNASEILPELGGAVGNTARGIAGGLWSLFQSLRGKK